MNTFHITNRLLKSTLFCGLLLFSSSALSCSSDDDGGGNGGDGGGTGPEPEPGNPEITPEQHKAKLETIGKEVAAQFNPEDSKAAIESLTALEELLAFPLRRRMRSQRPSRWQRSPQGPTSMRSPR
jgi:hypothetical protein